MDKNYMILPSHVKCSMYALRTYKEKLRSTVRVFSVPIGTGDSSFELTGSNNDEGRQRGSPGSDHPPSRIRMGACRPRKNHLLACHCPQKR